MDTTRPLISPFRGIRYNTAQARDLSPLLAPPYDIISPKLQEELYDRDPRNFVRIELPRDLDTDTEAENRYTRAAATLRTWLAEGVLIRDDRPAFYVVECEFALGGKTWRRRGVFAAVRLPEAGEDTVITHEGTFAGPKADRLRLMAATQAMISPVMSMYDDTNGALAQALYGVTTPPTAEGTDCEGVVQRLWVVQDEETVSAIRDAIGPGPLYIADGHHRFDTARMRRDELRGQHPDAPAEASFNYALMLLVSAQDEALRIRPTHRVVSGLGPEGVAWAKARMRERFRLLPYPAPRWEQVEDLLAAARAEHAFGVYDAKGVFGILTAREAAKPGGPLTDKLDVAVLHRELLDPMLEVHGEVRLAYLAEAREAAGAVRGGGSDFAFFLRPTRVEAVMAVARAREHMPRKSTYFYPKAAAGLVISVSSPEGL